MSAIPKMESKKVINSESCKRLLKDVKHIMKHPLTDNGIYYFHDEVDMTKGYAMIVGPKDTPYFGGYYFFKFDYPFDYPFSPPKVTYMTNDGRTRYNPNLYKCGKVCVSILNTWPGDKWSACQSITSVLLTLCSLLNDSPLENEPGYSRTHNDFEPYQQTIEYKNIDFAVCDLMDKLMIPNPFDMFYSVMEYHFLKNYEDLLSIVRNRLKTIKNDLVYVEAYNMTTHINYEKLETKLIQVKNAL